MSNSTDSRVISLSFDNDRFAENINASINSIDALNSKLNSLNGASYNFMGRGIGDANNGLNEMSNSLSNIEYRCSTIGIIGATIIQNLTTSAMNLFSTITRNIVSGGMTRALNIERARFQMEGLHMDVERIMGEDGPVQKAVKGTAYGLDEAAKAAAMLGASGVKFKDLEGSLTAISGAAAMSGRDYSSVADIFATVASNGKLMTQQLRQFSFSGLNIAATLADYYRTVRHESGMTEQKINEMVTEGKIDFNTFAEAMNWAFGEQSKKANKTFDGAMANIKAAWGRIGGDFFGGQNGDGFFEQIRYAIAGDKDDLENSVGLIGMIDSIRHALQPFIFTLNEIGMAASKKAYAGFTRISQGIDGFVELLNKKGSAPYKLLKNFKKSVELITDFISDLKFNKKNLGEFGTTVVSIFNSLTTIFTKMMPIFASFARIIGRVAMTILNGIDSILKGVATSGFFGTITKVIDTELGYISKGLSSASQILEKAFNKIGEVIKKVLSLATGSNLDNPNYFLGIFNVMGLVAIGKTLKNFNGFTMSFKGFLKVIEKSKIPMAWAEQHLGKLLDELRFSLIAFQQKLKADAIRNIAISIGILVGALYVLATIDMGSLSKGVAALEVLLVSLVVAMGHLTRMGDSLQSLEAGKLFAVTNVANFIGLATAMIGLGAGILILSKAVKTLGRLDLKSLAKGLGSVIVLLGAMMGAITLLTNLDFTTLKPSTLLAVSIALIAIGTAVDIMAKAVKTLGGMKPGNLAKGLLAIAGIMFGVMMMLETMSSLKLFMTGDGMIKAGLSILAIAGAIRIIADAVQVLGSMNPDNLARGLLSVIALLAAVTISIEYLSSAKLNFWGSTAAVAFSAGMILIAIAIRALVESARALGEMKVDTLTKGVTALIAIMLGLTAMVNGLPSFKILAAAAGLTSIAFAISILVGAIEKLGSIDTNTLKSSGLALGAIVLSLSVISYVASGAAGYMIAFGAALTVVGIGLTAITVGISGLIGLFGMLIATAGTFSKGIAGDIAVALGTLKDLGIAIGSFIAGAIAGAIDAMPDILSSMKDSIVNSIESLISLIGSLATKVLDTLKTYIGPIVSKLLDILGTIIDKVTEKIGPLIDKATTFIVALVNGIADSLIEHKDTIADALFNLLTSAFAVMINIGTGLPMLALNLIKMLAAGIMMAKDELSKAILTVVGKIPAAIKSKAASMLAAGRTIINNFKMGLISGANAAVAWAASIPQKIANKLANLKKSLKTVGSQSISGLVKGLTSTDIGKIASSLGAKLLKAVKKKLGIASPSKEMAKVGTFTIQGLVKGIANTTGELVNAANNTGDALMSTMQSSLENVYDSFGSFNTDPVITPVMDLSNVKSGAGMLDSMFSSDYAVGVGAVGNAGSTETLVNAIVTGVKDAINSAFNNGNGEGGAYNLTINSTLTCDGKSIAESSAQYMEPELNKLLVRANRKLGIV